MPHILTRLDCHTITVNLIPRHAHSGLHSHFVHGITFELFLWCDIAGMNAHLATERGVWWVILVVANASCQVAFHCPIIRGKISIDPKKPQVRA